MINESGTMTINTDNIFPIIKKWLYSDKDIFLRELVSNGCDAISKHKKLVAMGEAKEPESGYKITVGADPEQKCLWVEDNGIGMTAEELKKYINQIAFSGAVDFIDKYKDKTDASQIIGHFGLGFYSSFMVADKVSVDTLSYLEGADAATWTGDGNTSYTIEASQRSITGTKVMLYLSADGEEFVDIHRIREILEKYCGFMPYPIYLDEGDKPKTDAPADEKKAEDDQDNSEDQDQDQDKDTAPAEPKPVNDTQPLWLKTPRDCTDDEYKAFYTKVFRDFNEPLFWIHLNMDFPFNMKGILYFPRIRQRFGLNEGHIKLFYNQVFVAENIKEVIPEFLMLLNGVLDCPDLPLNVSRSFLQNDGYVAKISNHITKKVGDKLVSLFETQREDFNRYWEDIHPFVKYGCMREAKFYDRVKDILIFRLADGQSLTLKEYLERAREKHENQVFYATDERQQSQYLRLFKETGIDVVMLDNLIDNNFISFMEMKEDKAKFQRVDAEVADAIRHKDEDTSAISEEQKQGMEKLFQEITGKKELKVRFEPLKSEEIPAMLVVNEYSRRMQEMSRFYGDQRMIPDFPVEETLVLNASNGLVRSVLQMEQQARDGENIKMACHHLYDLAALAHRPLDPESMKGFIERSLAVMQRAFGGETE